MFNIVLIQLFIIIEGERGLLIQNLNNRVLPILINEYR